MTGDGHSAALVYTMRDLEQRAFQIIGEITEAGQPGFITSYGRFIAVITPLDPGEVESRVLGEIAREIAS